MIFFNFNLTSVSFRYGREGRGGWTGWHGKETRYKTRIKLQSLIKHVEMAIDDDSVLEKLKFIESNGNSHQIGESKYLQRLWL